MHHLVLALMIVLLPLRGWMGDAMATSMATGMATTVSASAHKTSLSKYLEGQASAQTALVADLQALPDCAGHFASQAAPAQDAHDAHDAHVAHDVKESHGGHGQPCQSCQACHTVALSPSLPDLRGAFIAPPMPRSVAAEFTSAVAALGQKPPIS